MHEQGQGTVEWIGLTCLVSLLFAALLAVGVRVSGTALADSIFNRILCATAMADTCNDEPHLIAAYGTEVGKLANDHMPNLAFERGSKALPVNFRRCRSTACGDGAEDPPSDFVRRAGKGLPVTAFVHVIDCRPGEAARSEAEGVDCSGERAGNLYLQYWTYYADSATLRGVPIVGAKGFHPDDWEGVQVRISPDGDVDQRASSHNGYNHDRGPLNWPSDVGAASLKSLFEKLGAHPRNGWGDETRWLFVSGGSHAGNARAFLPDFERIARSRQVHLIPLEPIASGRNPRFAVSPPWRKRVWRDPEAEETH
ncbi:MAG TPA: hypothetical protein VF176_04905 [Solirubrobacterales bacterium]